MFNKNIFAALALLGSLVSGNVFAKNEGLALGVHYSHNEMSIESFQVGGVTLELSEDDKDRFSNDASGGSLGLKYYFNLSNIVIAPTIFVDYLGNEVLDSASSDAFSVTYRFGGGLDLGFQINESFMLYATGGLVNTEYEIVENDITTSDFDDSIYYGAGLNIKLSKDARLNFEYNISEVGMEFNDDTDDTIDFKVQVLKAGIMLNF